MDQTPTLQFTGQPARWPRKVVGVTSRTPRTSVARVWPVATCWGLVPVVLVVDASLAIARGWWPASRVELLLLAAIAALGAMVLALTAGALRPRVRNWIAQSAGKLILLAVAVWGSLALVELSLHTVGRSLWIEPANVRPPDLRIVFHPRGDIMPGVSGDAHYSTNREGLRGSEMPRPEMPPREGGHGIIGRRIVCLGGSTTECTYLDDTETWPALVFELLNAEAVVGAVPRNWVGAAAVSGASTREHLRFVESSPLMDEIDTLVVLCGVNDLVLALRGDETWQAPAPWLWSRLALPKLAVRSWSRWTAASRMAAEDPEGRNYLARRAERAAAPTTDVRASLSEATAAYRARLKRIAEICRDRGVQLVLVEQPVLWRADLPDDAARLLWLGRLPDGHYLTARALRLAMDNFNRTMRGVAGEAGATFVNTSSLAGPPELFYDDCHLNERGAQELAALVAAALAPPLPAAPALSAAALRGDGGDGDRAAGR